MLFFLNTANIGNKQLADIAIARKPIRRNKVKTFRRRLPTFVLLKAYHFYSKYSIQGSILFEFFVVN